LLSRHSLHVALMLAGFLLLGTLFAREPKTFVLYRNGQPVPEYEDLIEKIDSGDTLVFSNNEKFVVNGEKHGQGTDLIMITSYKGKRAMLRISRMAPNARNPKTSVSKTVLGYGALSKTKIPIPDLLGHYNGEYVIQSWHPIQFTLQDILLKVHRVSKEEWAQDLYPKLLKFAASTHSFRVIGDLVAGQIAYDGERWMLLDWNDMHRLATPREISVEQTTSDDQPGRNAFSNLIEEELKLKELAQAMEEPGNVRTHSFNAQLFLRLDQAVRRRRAKILARALIPENIVSCTIGGAEAQIVP
jgi:hypothetical protein